MSKRFVAEASINYVTRSCFFLNTFHLLNLLFLQPRLTYIDESARCCQDEGTTHMKKTRTIRFLKIILKFITIRRDLVPIIRIFRFFNMHVPIGASYHMEIDVML